MAILPIPRNIPSLRELSSASFNALADGNPTRETMLQSYLPSSPSSREPTKIERLCVQKNCMIIPMAQKILETALANIDCIVYTTGSDGRLEKLDDRESSIELCCVVADQKQLEFCSIKIGEVIRAYPNLFFKNVEYKIIDQDRLYETLGKNIPMRVMQSTLLFGSNTLYQKFLRCFIDQIHGDLFKKSFRDFKKDFVSFSMSQLKKSNKGLNTSSVDFISGILAYDPSARNKGLKYCAIRSIQYSLCKVACEHLMNRPNEESYQFIQELLNHRQTSDLIDFLHEKGLLASLSEQEIDQLKNNYRCMMAYQTILQSLYSNQPVQLKLSATLARDLNKCFLSAEIILTKLSTGAIKR